MNIRFCGFGGQGILVAGRILGAAAMNAGRNVLQNQAYGSSARGGTCYSDVTISDEEILELESHELDVLVALSQQACDKFLPMLKEHGLLLTDEALVEIKGTILKDVKHFSFNATETAHNKWDRGILANIIMIGMLNEVTKILPNETIIDAIKAAVSLETQQMNFEAYNQGKEKIKSS